MNFDKLRVDPSKHFDKPSDVVEAEGVTRSQKLELLQQWQLDAHQLQEAAGEGMVGGESARLRAVNEALNVLQSDPENLSQ